MNILYKEKNKKLYYVSIFLYLIFTGSIILLSSGVLGIKMLSNRTNSMSPTINTGSLIFVKPSQEYQVGDIISFYSTHPNEIITHRIFQLGGNVYMTKGDANITYDQQLVRPERILGKVIYIFPFAGYIFTFIKTTVGVTLCILLPATVIITIEILKILSIFQKNK
jgi:signal peptidase